MADLTVPPHDVTSKARPPAPPNRIVTSFEDIAENTCSRTSELARMTSPDMMKSSARAKAECKRNNVALERDADVPHDCVIEAEDTVLQWLNRYSITSLRWPMFDCTSLLSWVWGLPMVVPIVELGYSFLVQFRLLVAGVCPFCR